MGAALVILALCIVVGVVFWFIIMPIIGFVSYNLFMFLGNHIFLRKKKNEYMPIQELFFWRW